MRTLAAGSHVHDIDAASAADLAALAARVAVAEAAASALAARVAALERPAYPASLQAAIDAAPAGATIDVTGGPVYAEALLVTRPLTLVGARISGAALPAGTIGIEVRETDRVTLRGCTVEDARYAGILVADSTHVTIDGCSVRRIDARRQNADMNAYGIAITDRGRRRSADCTITGCTVEDVPDWHGIDTHGGLRTAIVGCVVRRTNRAVFLTASALGPSTETTVDGCTLLEPTPRRDVLTTPPYNEVGITVVAGCTAKGAGNRIVGWPAGNAINVQPGATATFTATVLT